MEKQDFIKECNRQMANITDPKRRAAKRCYDGKESYIARTTRAKVAKVKLQKAKEKEARDNAKSKL